MLQCLRDDRTAATCLETSDVAKRALGYGRPVTPHAPVLRLTPELLDDRLRGLVESALRRPLTERILPVGDRAPVAATAPGESRVARAYQGLRALVEGSALHAGARRPLDELDALWGRAADAEGAVSLALPAPSEEALGEIERWLQIAPDERFL